MSLSPPLPNFERAEYEGAPPPPDECVYCHRGIATEYYRVDGNLACASCAQQAQSLIPPDSHKAYSRAVLFGIGAAIVGCIGYALVEILTGWTIGYVAIAVGYLVGKAMKAGSRGLGGKRYQVTAAILTYAAVAVAFVPIGIHELGQKSLQSQLSAPPPAPTFSDDASADSNPLPVSRTTTPPAAVAPNAPAPASVPAKARTAKPRPSFGKFVGAVLLLLGVGLISPLLVLVSSPFSGLIGIFILFIGISTAWRLMQRTASEVDGPFENTPSLR